MPWWVGITLALAAYLLLHHWATQTVAVSAQPGRIGATALQAVGRALAGIGQYVVPLICLVGAGVSAWHRAERKRLVDDVTHSRSADALHAMSWQQFERLVGEAFRLQGYRVAETGGGGADGGVDLVLIRGAEKFLVQCKQWRAFKVGVDVVRELYGVMAARGATGGFVITSGRFTADAVAFAQGRNIRLIDGPQLHALIRTAGGAASNPAAVDTHAEPRQAAAATAPSDALDAPRCPVCARAMVRRTARRGANAGRGFWGCPDDPACRGTRAIG